MLCPRCRLLLHRKSVNGIELDFCGGCRGVWFDGGELTAFATKIGFARNVLRSKLTNEKLVTGRGGPGCPKCARISMTVLLYESVEIDICAECMGMWLDAGELAGLIRWADGSAGSRTARAEKLENQLTERPSSPADVRSLARDLAFLNSVPSALQKLFGAI